MEMTWTLPTSRLSPWSWWGCSCPSRGRLVPSVGVVLSWVSQSGGAESEHPAVAKVVFGQRDRYP